MKRARALTQEYWFLMDERLCMEGGFVEWFGIPALTGRCQMSVTGE